MPSSAVDCIQPAVQHTREQLFTRFSWGQWSRLALVGILAAEIHAGGCNAGNFNVPSSTTRQTHPFSSSSSPFAHLFSHVDPARIAQFAGLIFTAVIVAFVLGIILMYVSSVFRFILFDAVIRKHCSISDGWHRLHRAGKRYFLWLIVLFIAQGLFMGILIAVPLALAAALGWFSNFSQHLARNAAAIAALVALFVIFLLTVAVVQVLAKDFLVPIMALEDVDFADGWSHLLAMIDREPGKFAVYLLLKVVLAIAAAIVFGVLVFIPTLLIISPAAVAVVAAHRAGITWNVTTVGAAIIGGSVLLVILAYVIAMICVPATVFFPAFALHFLAARYPKLDAVLNPAPPVPVLPPVVQPPPVTEPPPLPPSPEPIG